MIALVPECLLEQQEEGNDVAVSVLLRPVVYLVSDIRCLFIRIHVWEILHDGVSPSVFGPILLDEFVPLCDGLFLAGGCPVEHESFVKPGHDFHFGQRGLLEQAFVGAAHKSAKDVRKFSFHFVAFNHMGFVDQVGGELLQAIWGGANFPRFYGISS